MSIRHEKPDHPFSENTQCTPAISYENCSTREKCRWYPAPVGEKPRGVCIRNISPVLDVEDYDEIIKEMKIQAKSLYPRYQMMECNKYDDETSCHQNNTEVAQFCRWIESDKMCAGEEEWKSQGLFTRTDEWKERVEQLKRIRKDIPFRIPTIKATRVTTVKEKESKEAKEAKEIKDIDGYENLSKLAHIRQLLLGTEDRNYHNSLANQTKNLFSRIKDNINREYFFPTTKYEIAKLIGLDQDDEFKNFNIYRQAKRTLENLSGTIRFLLHDLVYTQRRRIAPLITSENPVEVEEAERFNNFVNDFGHFLLDYDS